MSGTLGLPLYNRSDHKGYLTVPFTRMTVDDYKRLYETDSNVYLARPSAQDSLTEANLTKVRPNTIPPAQQGNPRGTPSGDDHAGIPLQSSNRDTTAAPL